MLFLGIAEMAGGLGVAAGALPLAAIGLILVMPARSTRRSSSRRSPSEGPVSGGHRSGWHYDLMPMILSLVIITTNSGRYVLW